MKTTEELQRELKTATAEYNCAIANGLVGKSRGINRAIKAIERELSKANNRRPSLEEFPSSHRNAVYFLGVPRHEIVSAKEISVVPHVFDLHLRDKDGREWKGHLTVPPYSGRVPVTSTGDLIDQTQDCPSCRGSGKVVR